MPSASRSVTMIWCSMRVQNKEKWCMCELPPPHSHCPATIQPTHQHPTQTPFHFYNWNSSWGLLSLAAWWGSFPSIQIGLVLLPRSSWRDGTVALHWFLHPFSMPLLGYRWLPLTCHSSTVWWSGIFPSFSGDQSRLVGHHWLVGYQAGPVELVHFSNSWKYSIYLFFWPSSWGTGFLPLSSAGLSGFPNFPDSFFMVVWFPQVSLVSCLFCFCC